MSVLFWIPHAYIKPAFHCNKNKQVCEARAMFGRIARGGGRINIGRKGGWNVKRAMLCLLSIHYAYEKQTHKGEELFKRTKRVSWCLKGLQKSLIIETFCSSRIWREYGLFTFVQVYMHVQLFRALPVLWLCCVRLLESWNQLFKFFVFWGKFRSIKKFYEN